MLYMKGPLGIIADNTNQRVSIFDVNSLKVLQQIPLNADVIDAAVTSDCQFAVVTSFSSKTIYKIYLATRPARVIGSATAPTFLEDVQITPDNRFALSVDGSALNQNIVSYSMERDAFVSSLATSAQAVAVSPSCNGLVLTAVSGENVVHRFMIDDYGILIDTGQTFPAGVNPNNVNFSPRDKFAFVADYSGAVSVLSTAIPEKITLISTVPASSGVQSMAITRDGSYIFALGTSNVDIFTFDPVSGSLELARSFAHGLTIQPFYGVDQIALDPFETRLFISAQGQLAVFTTYGVPLGTVEGVSGPGGLAICPCKYNF